MSTERDQYLAKLRADTAYPAARSANKALSHTLHVFAALLVVAGAVLASQAFDFESGAVVFLNMFLYALLIVIVTRWLRGLATVLIDLGDAALDRGARDDD